MISSYQIEFLILLQINGLHWVFTCTKLLGPASCTDLLFIFSRFKWKHEFNLMINCGTFYHSYWHLNTRYNEMIVKMYLPPTKKQHNNLNGSPNAIKGCESRGAQELLNKWVVRRTTRDTASTWSSVLILWLFNDS